MSLCVAAVAELAEEFIQSVGEWSEQRSQAAWRRQEEQARQAETERAGHEPVTPEPTTDHEDAGRHHTSSGESDED